MTEELSTSVKTPHEAAPLGEMDAAMALRSRAGKLRELSAVFRKEFTLDLPAAEPGSYLPLDVKQAEVKLASAFSFEDPRKEASLEGEYQFACGLYRLAHDLPLSAEMVDALLSEKNKRHYREYVVERQMARLQYTHDNFHPNTSLLPEKVARFDVETEGREAASDDGKKIFVKKITDLKQQALETFDQLSNALDEARDAALSIPQQERAKLFTGAFHARSLSIAAQRR